MNDHFIPALAIRQMRSVSGFMTHFTRADIASAVEVLVALLDMLDDDPDLEAEPDLENDDPREDDDPDVENDCREYEGGL